jgi:integrase
LLRKVDLEGETLHGLRATYITLGLENGVPGVQMQRLVGHSDLATTMRYHRLTELSQQAALKAVTALGLCDRREESQQNSQQEDDSVELQRVQVGR